MIREREVFIKDWQLDAFVGIHAFEYAKPQPLRLNLRFWQADTLAGHTQTLADVVDYDAHKQRITQLIATKHEPLLETLAERIAQTCLLHDPKICRIVVQIEKLAIYGDAISGVRLERVRGDYTQAAHKLTKYE